MNKSELILHIGTRLPKGNCITKIDAVTDDNAIRFDWLGESYRVTTSLGVERVFDGMLSYGGARVLLMESVLKGGNS